MPDEQKIVSFDPLADVVGVFEEERPDPLVSEEERPGLAGRGSANSECHCSSMMMG